MKKYTALLSLAASFFTSANVMAEPVQSGLTVNGCPATLDFTLRELDGDKTVHLCEAYKGKVVIIVNTASKCGFTPQFEGLEAMHEKYKDQGLAILGFPSNDFGGQDPGSEKEIAEFCRLTYSVKFPMFEKTHAAKRNASPIYKVLGDMAGEYPRWNFHKYVLDTEGRLIGSFSSFTTPDSKKLVNLIEDNLPQK